MYDIRPKDSIFWLESKEGTVLQSVFNPVLSLELAVRSNKQSSYEMFLPLYLTKVKVELPQCLRC
jgi:hypothetical protein